MKRISTLLALVAVSLMPTILRAAPFDDRIPKDALVYAGWRGSEDLSAQYAASNLKGVLETAGMHAYLEQQLPKWIEAASEKDADAQQQINDGLAALDIAWRHPTALYVGPAEFQAADAPPKPRFALMCDAGPDAQKLVDLIQKSVAKEPPPPDANFKVTNQGNIVFVTIGLSNPEDFAPHADALKTSPIYAKALKRIHPDAAITFFADTHAILQNIHDGMEKSGDVPPEAKQKYDAVVKALGIANTGEIIYGAGFDKKEWVDEGFFATGPRTGLLSLFDQAPLDDAALNVVPADAVSFNATRLDPQKAFSTIRDALGQIDPEVQQQFNQGIEAANAQLGFNLETDFIGTLGDTWVYYRNPSPDGVGLAQTAVIKLKDSDKFATTLKTIETQVVAQSDGKVTLDQVEVEGIPTTQIHVSMVNAAYAVRNGYLYISTPTAIAAAVQNVEKKNPSILTNQSFLTARAALPKAPAISMNYADPAKIYPELYRSAAMILPLLGAAGINIPITILPNPAKSAPFMTPGAGECWTDAEGVHFASRTSMPGANLLSDNTSVYPSLATLVGGVTIHIPIRAIRPVVGAVAAPLSAIPGNTP